MNGRCDGQFYWWWVCWEGLPLIGGDERLLCGGETNKKERTKNNLKNFYAWQENMESNQFGIKKKNSKPVRFPNGLSGVRNYHDKK